MARMGARRHHTIPVYPVDGMGAAARGEGRVDETRAYPALVLASGMTATFGVG